MRTTCFQSLAWAPLIGRNKGDAAAFSWAGMNGPAHGRFRLVMRNWHGDPGLASFRRGELASFGDAELARRLGIGFVS
jgi:hypothetical protein